MEFRQILYFDMVFRSESISQAAQKLFVTQQCVSKQISLLEKELGTRLLLRNQKGIIPTEEGKWFHEHAAMILQLERDIQFHFDAANRKSPDLLRVGISNGLNIFYDDNFFQDLRNKYPEQNIQVSYMWNRQIEEMLEEGAIDMGISLLPIQSDNLVIESLFSEPFCCVMNRTHPLSGKEILHFEDIAHEKIAMADENFNTYGSFLKLCQESGIIPDIYKASDLMSIYVYVLNHNAVGFSLSAFADRFQIDQIRHIPYEDVGGSWEVCMLTNEKASHRYGGYLSDFSNIRSTSSLR